MSNRIFQAVWDNGPKARSEMIVLMVLADCADAETGTCFPSIKHIAHHARMSRRSAIRVLSALETEGWISVQPQKRRDGSSTSNIYSVSFEMLGLQQFVRRHNARHKQGCQNDTPPCQNDTPSGAKKTPYVGCQNDTPVTNQQEQSGKKRDTFQEWRDLPQPKPPYALWMAQHGL